MFEKPTYEQLEQRVKELERSEALFRGLFDNMPSGSAIYEVINEGKCGSDYIVKEFNNTSLELEGKPLGQIRGRSLHELRPNIDEYGLLPVLRKVWETGDPAYFPVTIYEDGNFSRYYENYVFKIPTGEVVAIYNDVSDQQQTAITAEKAKGRLGLALRFANDGLFDWNLETNKMYYSPVWKSLLGYEDHEVKNEFSEWERLTRPEDVETSWKMLKELFEGKRDRFEKEFKMVHKDGHWVDILSRANLIYNEEGKAVRLVGTHVDITERKKMESELRESKALLQAAMDQSHVGIAIAEAPDGKLRYVNEAGLGIRGKSKKEVVDGIGIQQYVESWQIMHPDGTPYTFDEVPLARAIIHGEVSTKEFIVRRPHLEDRLVWANAAPIFDDNGNITAGIAIFLDITDHKNIEKALAQSDARYRALFDFNPVQTIVVNNDGQIVMFNFATKKVAGKLPAIGSVMYHDYAEKHEVDMYAELMECLQDGKNREYSEMKYKERCLNIQIAPYSDGAIITSEDVTEKMQLQTLLEQARKMETVGTLSGGIAHEFNNVLGVIMGNVELAMDDVPEWNSAYKFMLEVKEASVRGREIVKQLLSFSHKSNWKQEPLNIANIVGKSVKLLRTTIPSNIKFNQEIAADCSAILGDRTQIHQLMMNLCRNAAQSMEDTGGMVNIVLDQKHITAERFFAGQCLDPGHYVQLTIADTGIGIAPRIIESVFDPFFTTKAVDKGTGLGLAVVYGIVNRHSGFIEIESEPNIGTKVICYFPFTEEKAVTTQKRSAALPGGNETILFVDDDAVLARMGQLQLERLGYSVEPHTNPSEALERVKNNPEKYDLVITDMTMPEMAGDQLIKALKSIKKEIKTIICTGYSKRLNGKEAGGIGANGYMMKPVGRKEMSETVRRVLDNPYL